MSTATQQSEHHVKFHMKDNKAATDKATTRTISNGAEEKEQATVSDLQGSVNKTAMAFGEIVALLSRSPFIGI